MAGRDELELLAPARDADAPRRGRPRSASAHAAILDAAVALDAPELVEQAHLNRRAEHLLDAVLVGAELIAAVDQRDLSSKADERVGPVHCAVPPADDQHAL